MTDQMKKPRRKYLGISSLWKFYLTGKISFHLLWDNKKAVFTNNTVIQIKKQCVLLCTLCRTSFFLTSLVSTEKNCSEACKNMPELLLRGHHFLKDVEYHKCRMDDVRKTG